MSRFFSIYLDAVRVAAAFLVLVSHFAYERLTGGDYQWIVDYRLGADGVVIFFVMSGFVIAASAERRVEEGLGAFVADRLSRLWSVAIPAACLTLLVDPVGIMFAPELYRDCFEGDAIWVRFLAAISFTNEAFGQSIRLGSNGPWWSLSYEAIYYALFAAAFFLRGFFRIATLASLIIIAGWKILILMPAWLTGVALWKVISKRDRNDKPRVVSLALVILPVVLYPLAHLLGIVTALTDATLYMAGLFGVEQDIAFSYNAIWAVLLGLLVACHLAGVADLKLSLKPEPGYLSNSLKWLAGGSFALYLMHYPLLQLFAAWLPGTPEELWRQLMLLGLTVAACYILAEVTERRREPLRRLLRNWLTGTPITQTRATVTQKRSDALLPNA